MHPGVCCSFISAAYDTKRLPSSFRSLEVGTVGSVVYLQLLKGYHVAGLRNFTVLLVHWRLNKIPNVLRHYTVLWYIGA